VQGFACEKAWAMKGQRLSLTTAPDPQFLM
jgi:hypothetical protein